VVLNAGVALYAANVANSMQAGIHLAQLAIESGAAKAKLDALVRASNALSVV
jgi:anthranilate phosphoribosyltransferase